MRRTGEIRADAAAIAAVAALAVALFAGTVGHGFVFDDRPIVERQPDLRSLRNFGSIVTRDWWNDLAYDRLWRPLTLLSYATEATLCWPPAPAPPDPRPHHFGNVALHALVSALVFLLGRSAGLGRWPALAGGLLFAVAGVHVEPVANIVGRAELLATLFSVTALLAHRRTGAAAAVVATLAFTLGLLSKESAIAFLAWAPLADGLLDRRLRWRRYGLYALAIAGYLVARYAVLGSLTRPLEGLAIDNPIAGADWLTGRMTAIAVLGRYAAAVAWPADLAPNYGFDQTSLVTSPIDPWLALGLATHGGLLAAALWHARRAPIFAFSALAYLTALFPVSNVLITIGTIRADRLLYLPSVGLVLAVTCELGALRRRKPRAAVLVLVGILSYQSALALRAAPVWRDDLTLFTHAERVAPRSVVGLTALAFARFEAGEIEGALAVMRRAAAIGDFNIKTLNQLGELELRHGSRDAAEAVFRRAVELEPANHVGWNYLGSIRLERGDAAAALDAFTRATAAKPGHAASLFNRGRALAALGRFDEALAAFEATLASDPGHAAALRAAAQLHLQRGDRARATELGRRLQQLRGPAPGGAPP